MDKEIKKKYISDKLTLLKIVSIFDLIYCSIFVLIYFTCSHKFFNGVMYATIYLDVPITCAGLLMQFEGDEYLCQDGTKCKTVLGIILRCLTFELTFVPIMKILVYMSYDLQTNTFEINILKILVLAPILFIALVVTGLGSRYIFGAIHEYLLRKMR